MVQGPEGVGRRPPSALLPNLVLFGRLLRGLGVPVTPTRVATLVRALSEVDLSRKEDVKAAARAVLVSRQAHLAPFDRAFELFWRARRGTAPAIPGPAELAPPQRRSQGRALAAVEARGEPDPDLPEAPEPLVERRYTYSPREVLRRKDFADLSAEELAEVQALLQTLSFDLEPRESRRKVAAPSGRHLDLRRLLRRSQRYGGEPVELAFRQRKLKRRPLVVLCDVSGSMAAYSRILLQFVYAVSRGLGRVESFLFGTRLTRVTRQLRQRDVAAALRQATAEVLDWGGGTRIGEAVKEFNYRWARRVLGQGAVVLVISDGWDRGDVDLLAREMARLRRSCQRLVWLNPLLGLPSYRPLTRGIQAALPHVHDFLPVHNLASLEQLGRLLAQWSGGGRAREQGTVRQGLG